MCIYNVYIYTRKLGRTEAVEQRDCQALMARAAGRFRSRPSTCPTNTASDQNFIFDHFLYLFYI